MNTYTLCMNVDVQCHMMSYVSHVLIHGFSMLQHVRATHASKVRVHIDQAIEANAPTKAAADVSKC